MVENLPLDKSMLELNGKGKEHNDAVTEDVRQCGNIPYAFKTMAQLRMDMRFPINVNKKRAIITCPVCLKQYMKCNKWNHEKTKYHQIYAKLNNNLRDLLVLETK